MTHDGELINGLKKMVENSEQKAKLKGVQLPLGSPEPLAYRVRTANGGLILCDRHLDLLRKKEPVSLTGESFPVNLCDHCEDEMERGRR